LVEVVEVPAGLLEAAGVPVGLVEAAGVFVGVAGLVELCCALELMAVSISLLMATTCSSSLNCAS